MSEQLVLTHLSDLKPGDEAIVQSITGEHNDRRRFMELGFVVGATVKARRVAPFGDPVQYRIKGFDVSLRRKQAALIMVTVL